MHVILLCAGYATRMYPLTQNTPKHLLPLGGRPAIEYLIDNLAQLPINDLVIVTNQKFAQHFERWKKITSLPVRVTILNDGTTTEKTRLGSLGDLAFALKALPEDDVLVAAGDNILVDDLQPAYRAFTTKGNLILTVHVRDPRTLTKYNEVTINTEKQVIDFVEKPVNPRQHLRALCFYFLRSSAASQVTRYLAEGNDPDKAGNFISWLHKREPVFAFPYQGKEYDIGSLELYRAYDREFSDSHSKKG